jgi:hypothetical protein
MATKAVDHSILARIAKKGVDFSIDFIFNDSVLKINKLIKLEPG